jgi:hypothetical protein
MKGQGFQTNSIHQTCSRLRQRDRELIVSLTPITNPNSVLSPSIKHRTDDHEARGDGAFAHSEDETDGQETSEVLASGMAT